MGDTVIPVTLIVTGDAERIALADSIAALMPGCFDLRVQKVASITSTPVPPTIDARWTRRGSPAWNMVERLWKSVTEPVIAGADPSRFAFAIDDLELANRPPLGEPANVVGLVRAAVESFLADQFSSDRARERHRELLRERCSFHLLAPMLEAYFFGERGALTRAGVPVGREAHRAAGDVESFRANDPSWSAPQSPAWQAMRDRRARGRQNPDDHPKDYLDFLRDPTAPTYKETRDGVAALRTLAWRDVAWDSRDGLGFARAFFADLASAADQPPPLGDAQGDPVTWASRRGGPRTLALRNL